MTQLNHEVQNEAVQQIKQYNQNMAATFAMIAISTDLEFHSSALAIPLSTAAFKSIPDSVCSHLCNRSRKDRKLLSVRKAQKEGL